MTTNRLFKPDLNRLHSALVRLKTRLLLACRTNDNLSGLQHVCHVDEYPDDKWNELIAVMLSAPFHLIKRFLPAMKKKGSTV
jgi:NAD(P)-dependent dehydrogenase (short-subunit alcohol dehydrogenase family)